MMQMAHLTMWINIYHNSGLVLEAKFGYMFANSFLCSGIKGAGSSSFHVTVVFSDPDGNFSASASL